MEELIYMSATAILPDPNNYKSRFLSTWLVSTCMPLFKGEYPYGLKPFVSDVLFEWSLNVCYPVFQTIFDKVCC